VPPRAQSSSDVHALTSGDLHIDVDVPVAGGGGGTIVCRWTGKSNDRSPQQALAPWFEALLGDAGARAAKVEMHFEKLEHFNSSTITALIRFIQTARTRGVKLAFVYDPNLKWQRLSFDALRVFDKGDHAFELVTA
jgi:hypothetical protein